jgi:hypothetical protein
MILTEAVAENGACRHVPTIIIDADSRALSEHPALVKSTRKARARFPAGCVEPLTSEEEACARSRERRGWRAAIVYGPSASSEGQKLYYLVRWLECADSA